MLGLMDFLGYLFLVRYMNDMLVMPDLFNLPLCQTNQISLGWSACQITMAFRT